MEKSWRWLIMKNNFLYKEESNKIGVLKHSESLEDSMWFMSEEYDNFIKNINSLDTKEFLLFFISLFKDQKPNSSRVLGTLSSDIINESNTLFVENELSRNDLKSIKMFLSDLENLNSIELIEMIFINDVSEIFIEVNTFIKNTKLKKMDYNILEINITFHL